MSTPSLMDEASQNPPPGLNYTLNVQHSMAMAILATMFASLLLPMMIALFFFAANHTCRRTYIFWLNVAAVVIGIVEGIYLIGIEIRSALNPPLPDGFIFVWYILSFSTPIFVEIILIFRLSAVYASETTSTRLRRFVVGFPIVWKFMRIAIITTMIVVWITSMRGKGIPVEITLMGWSEFPYPMLAWGFQVLDNTFCSIAFLKRLDSRIRQSSQIRNGSDMKHPRNAVARLRTIFVIALANYVVPTVIAIVHLILAIINDHQRDPRLIYLCAYLQILNSYSTIIGVVFATVWATSREWAGSHTLCTGELSSPVFSSTSSGITPFHTSSTNNMRPGNSPNSTPLLANPYPSGVQTPMSPDFPLVHYAGYHQGVKFAPKGELKDSVGEITDSSPLRIHVSMQTVRKYDVEVGSLQEDDDRELPLTPFSSPQHFEPVSSMKDL